MAFPRRLRRQWREVAVSTVEGDLINRCELFDETDLDVAREIRTMSRPLPAGKAATGRSTLLGNFPARGWDVMAQILAVDFSLDDRRQVLSAASDRGRDTEIENLKAMADVGVDVVTSAAIATHGEPRPRRLRFSGQDEEPEAFCRMLGVVEINTETGTGFLRSTSTTSAPYETRRAVSCG